VKLTCLIPLALVAPEPRHARRGAELPFDRGLKLRGRFREFLAAFGYMCPAFRTVAIDMHLGFEPSCIVERARFNSTDWLNAQPHNGHSSFDQEIFLVSTTPIFKARFLVWAYPTILGRRRGKEVGIAGTSAAIPTHQPSALGGRGVVGG
jgi:hypothetical protein